MKEYGPKGFNPQEKLTGEAQKTYALGGDSNMAEGISNELENFYGNQSRPDLRDHTGRSIYPEHQDPSPGVIDPRKPDVSLTTEEEAKRLRQAWIENYRKIYKQEPNVDALRAIDLIAETGNQPLDYNPTENVRSGRANPVQTSKSFESNQTETTPFDLPSRDELRASNPQMSDSELDNLIKELSVKQKEAAARDPRRTSSKAERIRKNQEDEEIERAYGEKKINSIQNLVKEILRYAPEKGFHTGEEFELLNEKDEFQPQNFLRWVRHRMMYWHNDNPNAEYDFSNQIQIIRNYSRISIGEMVNNPERYFKDENKLNKEGESVIYTDLVDEIKRETWLFGESRKFDIEYQQTMGSEDDLAKTLLKNYYLNTFTRTIWDRSSLYWIFNMAQEFKGAENTKDAKVGQALTGAYLTYYNLGDREMLIKILGKDAPLLQATKIVEKIKELAKDKGLSPEEYMDPSLWRNLTIENPKNSDVMNFINIFNSPGKNGRMVDVTQSLIRDSLREIYDLYVIDPKNGEKKADLSSIEFAETFGKSMARWTGGAARNDTSSVGYDAWTKLQDVDDYRLKQPKRERGGAFGNPYSVHAVKQLGLDLFSGIFTETRDPHKVGEYKQKTPIQVLLEMSKIGIDNYEEYKKINSQLIFQENAMRSFTIDHYNRGLTVFKQIMAGEEIKLDKFTKYDYLHGLQFERGPFEEALKEKFFKPMRYAYSTYSMLDYAQEVRAKVTVNEKNPKTGKVESVVKYKTLHMAESMFGREVLHIPHFWKDPKNPPDIRNEDWAEHLDWEKINSKEGKVWIWRRLALTRLAAELYAHRDRHSTDPKYNMLYFENILDALEQLPDDVAGDEFNLQGNKAVGKFFTKEEIKWLREKASVTKFILNRNQFLYDVGSGVVTGFVEAVKSTAKSIASNK